MLVVRSFFRACSSIRRGLILAMTSFLIIVAIRGPSVGWSAGVTPSPIQALESDGLAEIDMLPLLRNERLRCEDPVVSPLVALGRDICVGSAVATGDIIVYPFGRPACKVLSGHGFLRLQLHVSCSGNYESIHVGFTRGQLARCGAEWVAIKDLQLSTSHQVSSVFPMVLTSSLAAEGRFRCRSGRLTIDVVATGLVLTATTVASGHVPAEPRVVRPL